MKQNTYCVIMAGGVGSRFWPLSTTKTPKQFLDILGTGRSLLQQTFDRFKPICPIDNFLIVTSNVYKDTVIRQLPQISADQILAEPARKNTAPCIAFANAIIKSQNPNAHIIVSPADHLIINEDQFRKNIVEGLQFVSNRDALLTLGIHPSRPETGYGYIQIDGEIEQESFQKVKTFTEKPNYEMAKIFHESGEFFWNSGIFLWTLNSIEKAFKSHLYDIHRLFDVFYPSIGTLNEAKALNEAYIECKNISIDYGIMEKAENVFVQTVNFGWSDLGTWSSLHEHSEKDENDNALINGNILLYDTKNCVVHLPQDKIGVIQGLENYIIVQSKNSLLICPRENEQQIRQFTTDIRTELGTEDN